MPQGRVSVAVHSYVQFFFRIAAVRTLLLQRALEIKSSFIVPSLVIYLHLYSHKLFCFLEKRSHVMDVFSTYVATLWVSQIIYIFTLFKY